MLVKSRLAVALALASGLFSAANSYAQSLTRGPYLQTPTDSAITVRWRTNSSTDSVVRYGTSPSNLNQTASVTGSRTEHEVRITGLSADSQYYYSVGTSGQTIAGGNTDYRFATSPVPGTDVDTRIWIIGDSGTANSNAAAVYNAYRNFPGFEQTDLWLMLGDNAYSSGTDNQYQNAVFNMYPELLRFSPVWSALGNHDGASADSGSQSGTYYNIFSFPRNGESGGLPSGTEAYYSFDYGDIHFICLDSHDSDRSPNGAMMTWMENDIAATNKTWIVAFWHHPPYTKGSHDSDNEGRLIDMRQNALPILEDYGVDLVFTGHSHAYERSFLIDSHYGSSSTFNSNHVIDGGNGREDGTGAYQKQEGIGHTGAVYTVAGSSGQISGGSLDHPAMYTSQNQLGSVVLDVSGNRLNAQFLRADGTVSDYYTLEKGEDTTAPSLSNAEATSASNVLVSFSEAVANNSGANTSNYSISNGVSVLNANAAGNQVNLTTSELSEGVNYTLTVSGVADTNGNVIAPNSQASFEFLNVQTTALQNGVSGYNGTQDTWIGSGVPNSNFGSSTTIVADGDDGGNGETATLVQWDLSSLPAGAVITEAQVELTVFNISNGAYNLYDTGTSWSENSATWNSIDPLNNRGAQVGSFVPSTTGIHTINLNNAGINLVQNWVDRANNGLLVMTGGTVDGLDMRSSEFGTVSQRPRLILTYGVSGGSNGGGNKAPNAGFNVNTNNLNAVFSDASSDSDGNIASWAWSFGDGNSASQQNPTHNYSSAGDYTVTLTVTDDQGATDSTSQTVTATNGNAPVTATFRQGLNGFSGAQDTYVASGSTGANFGNSTAILADGDDGSRDELISLLQWDVSNIPAGSTVTNATITLQVFNRSNNVYNLWQMLVGWNEANATWNNTNPASNRGSLVGSFNPTGTGAYTIDLNAAGIALIQSWINGSANNGVTVQSSGTRNGIDMRSSEYGTQNQRPTLTVTYE